jgi:hypothetical protein
MLRYARVPNKTAGRRGRSKLRNRLSPVLGPTGGVTECDCAAPCLGVQPEQRWVGLCFQMLAAGVIQALESPRRLWGDTGLG